MRSIVAIYSAALMVAAYGISAHAEPSCMPTVQVASQNYPGAAAIVPSNNLLKPAGKALEANGQKIIIEGRVVDSRCAPVQEAVVELWQNSPTGRWLLAGREDLASANPVFTGAGRTYTDSDGRFTFTTAFPAPLGKRAPFLNIKVSGRNVPTLTTALFFSDDVRNDKDDGYRKLSGKARSDVTIKVKQDDDEQLVGDIQLVIAGKAAYQAY